MGWAQAERRRLAAELAACALCCLVAIGLVGLHVGRSPAGGPWAAGSALCAATALVLGARAGQAQWCARPTTPAAVARAWDGSAARGPRHGLASAALHLGAGAGVGAPDLIALALHQAQEALAARPHRPAAIRPPALAIALLALGLLLSPSAALRPSAGPTAPSATAPITGAAAADRPVLLDVLDAIVGLTPAMVSGRAGGTGVGGGAGGADGVAAGAAGGAGDSSGVAAQGAGADGQARGGAAGSSPSRAGQEASPPAVDTPERPPEVPEAVQLMGAGRSVANDGDDPEAGAPSGGGPRNDAPGGAQTELPGGEVDAQAAARAEAGARLDTPETPEAGDRPTETGAQGKGVESGDDGPQVQDLDERVTWEAPGARPGAGGANDASGTQNGREQADATATTPEEQLLWSQRVAGDGGVQAATARGAAARGQAGHTITSAGAATQTEAAAARARVPAPRLAWISAALQPEAPAPPAPTASADGEEDPP